MLSWAPIYRAVRLLFALGLISSVVYIAFHSGPPRSAANAILKTYNSVRSFKPDVTLVAASIKEEDTTWLTEAFPEWRKIIYETDDPNSPFVIPGNRGHEVMVYLSYIIDHYDDLSPITIFHHAIRYQWHTDDPAYDGLRQLRRLQLPYVQEAGYANLRCAWEPGCPRQYPMYTDDTRKILDQAPTNEHWPQLYEYIYNETAPDAAGQACCAEFAVADWQIRLTAKKKYILARRWLVETFLVDGLSGRIMEYMWHILFGRDPLHCPSAGECYCKTYGMCDMECANDGNCSVWINPGDHDHFQKLPNGWPQFGFDGKPQDVSLL